MFLRGLAPFFFLLFATALQAATFTADGDLLGDVTHYRVGKKDNLYEIARRFDLGIVELLAANPGIDPWIPKEGTDLILPTGHILPDAVHAGIVINLAALRLFYFNQDGSVMSFPIGIGMEGWQTPTGTTSIVMKRAHPAWIPPASIREVEPDLPEIIPAGPDNPLGLRALNLGWQNYIIHGTNRPFGIGKRSSHGCIRLYPEDIEVLFNAVQEGTQVTVIDAPYTLGWKGDELYLEVTPTQKQADTIAQYQRPPPQIIPELYDVIYKKAGDETDINWDAVGDAVLKRSGTPTLIGKKRSGYFF